MASEEVLQLPSLELKTRAGSAGINTQAVPRQLQLSNPFKKKTTFTLEYFPPLNKYISELIGALVRP